MRKKIIAVITILTLSFALTACGSKEAAKTTNTNTTDQTAAKSDTVKIPAGLGTEMGVGKIIVSTPSGTSENGAVPFIYVEKDSLVQIGFDALEFDGAKLSYIFIDGVLNSKEQLKDTQTSLNLKDDEVKVGKHKVEVVQFDTDKVDGKALTYKSASYEVKAK